MNTDLPRPPTVSLDSTALLLDFDGTLIPYAGQDLLQPTVGDHLLTLLVDLQSATDGAAGIVSGRGIAELDGLLDPVKLAMSGTHGSEIRLSPADPPSLVVSSEGYEEMVQQAQKWGHEHPDTMIEKKFITVAIHFHGLPDLEPAARDFALRMEAEHPNYAAQFGRGVIEMKPKGVDKASGCARLMQQGPFLGRQPLFVGDDVADEEGFAFVNARDGVSIKVGPGETSARYRLDDADAVRTYLASLL
ncbi:MAG: trehalose-phosphatase [Okeania sp. SIO3C4]|nr:trehalose-phosphatase [Okeania sp. SIO3C4]